MRDGSLVRRLAVAAAVVAALVLGWSLGRVGQPGGDAADDAARSDALDRPMQRGDAAADAPRGRTDRRAGTPSTAAASRPAVASALPPLNMPLRETIDDLSRRAAAGEPAAACRLAAEYTHCNELEDSLASMQQMLELQETSAHVRAEAGGVAVRIHDRADDMQRSIDGMIRETAHCDGVAPLPPAALFDRWLQAAKAGSVTAMTHYAAGTPFRRHQLLDSLPALQQYRRNAPQLARRAYEAGDLDAAVALARALAAEPDDANRPLLAQALRPDPAEALTILLRIRAGRADGPRHMPRVVVDAQIERVGARLDARERAQAEARAARLGPLGARSPTHWDLAVNGLAYGETGAQATGKLMRRACESG
ncbi:hypothetical protein [Cognatilysobacter tabacisoli]|uniref:hypothetical protein n=1 Tax=Cognatilysobacter tabacisoli TaxID=2315424 RepID=UPI001300A9F3|nr:hypothetical protein [Lysobacter tabacisoli]